MHHSNKDKYSLVGTLENVDKHGFIPVKCYLSDILLETAVRHAQKAHEIEKEADGYDFSSDPDGWEATNSHLTSYALSAVVLSTNYLECTINEIYSDASENHERFDHLAANMVEKIAAFYEYFEESGKEPSVLGKYQHFLKLSGLEALPEDKNPWQDAKLLIDLRNAITHFKAEPRRVFVPPNKPEKLTRLERLELGLKSKFKPNPLTRWGTGFPLFPERCFGYGCARWGVLSAMLLVEKFFEYTKVSYSCPAKQNYLPPLVDCKISTP